MFMILLSGGSGKRLWPLSNGVRSKQFLRLLQSPSGEEESMLQRVRRQIGETFETVSVTIATGWTQLEAIRNQLGDNVDVVAEPERRDTFPAIALSVSYLFFEKGVADDDVIVVMPCDTYAESGYFDAVRKMATLVEEGTAEIALMGVVPSYPSTKYGYIVPSVAVAEEGCRRVERFVEKPDSDKAAELLSCGAYWNGGVFAFRAGYMMDIVRKYCSARSFATVRDGYSVFPKISFDYEVVEKAASLAVVPYRGEWKDLGTWNTLAEKMPRNAVGNVVLGDDVKDTVVINELERPVVCDGVCGIVVAAGHDGIVVCGKDSAERIKQYVEHIDSRPMYEERRWGSCRVLEERLNADNTRSLVKSITVETGCGTAYEKHKNRDEVCAFVSGTGLLAVNDDVREIKAGDTVVIPKGTLHAVMAVTELNFVEVQIGSILLEDDAECHEWNWKNRDYNLKEYSL